MGNVNLHNLRRGGIGERRKSQKKREVRRNLSQSKTTCE
jgi:hypothetical protein